MKKFIMTLVLIPMMALADTEIVNGIEWTFTISEGKATVGPGVWKYPAYLPAISTETTGDLVVPSTLGGSPVTSIGEHAFYGCNGLTSVTIPSSVETISKGAFAECVNLSRAIFDSGAYNVYAAFPSSACLVIRFNDKSEFAAFNGNWIRWAGIAGKDSGGYYGGAAKWYAESNGAVLTELCIPAGVLQIVAGAFSGCIGLTSVVLPEGVASIGDSAFAGCVDLTSVTIPSSVTSIGGSAFSGCTGLTSVTIPSSVTSIGGSAFRDCSSLLRAYYRGNAPTLGGGIYDGTPVTLVSYVREGSTGWSSGASADLPDSWQGRSIAHGEAPAVIDGVEWNFTTKNGRVSLGTGLMTAVGGSVSGAVTIPAEINGMKVVEVKDNAFAGLDGITSVVIPASVRTVGSKAFYGCDGLESVTFLGDAPYVYDDAFSGTKSMLAFSVPQGSIGWSDTSLTGLPGAWKGHAIQYAGGGQDAGGGAAALGTVTVSNIVVHYVLNSVQPQFAISPSQDMGFVNIITEVKSTGVAAIPMSWAMNYPNFVSKFGSDFTAALGKPTGKIGTGGTPMLVWQDYVAGTDPTDENDVFRASITIVDGKVTISYTPELDDARKEMRKYTTWGKTSLMDTDWTEVQDGHEAEYNFFKVSVEMR